MTPKTTDPDLALTGAQVAAIVNDAQTAADDAARAVRAAEATIRGDDHPDAHGLRAVDITAARLAELRAEAEHAALLVPAAERRAAEVTEKQLAAHRAKTLAKIRAEAADDLTGAEHLVDQLDALETALRGLYEGVAAHNARVARWAGEMSGAGIRPADVGGSGPDGMSYRTDSGEIRIDGRGFAPLNPAQLVGATLHRVTEHMPPRARMYDGRQMVFRDWIEAGVSLGDWSPVDLRARIRRDA